METDNLKDVHCFVEATSFEQFCLWEKHHEEMNWKENLAGYFIYVAEHYKKPVCISLFKAEVQGKILGFWHATSQIVNYKKIDEWFKKMAPDAKHTDAMNFHNAF